TITSGSGRWSGTDARMLRIGVGCPDAWRSHHLGRVPPASAVRRSRAWPGAAARSGRGHLVEESQDLSDAPVLGEHCDVEALDQRFASHGPEPPGEAHQTAVAVECGATG